MKHTDEYLVENCILCFLHHYPNHASAVDAADLLDRLRKGEYPTPKKQGHGRPAKRQRSKT